MISFLKSLIGDRSAIRLKWHHAKAFVAAARFGFPAKKLTVIGVTGTDGKTTTVAMITAILRGAKISAGGASTAFLQINDVIRPNDTHLTSLSPFQLQKFFRQLVTEKCTHAVVEMSSHGLVQHRTDYTWPKVAVITNTSLEHLDYHGTMEQYRKDKGLLFEMLDGNGVKVLNEEDETFITYSKIKSERTFSFTMNQAQRKSPEHIAKRFRVTDMKSDAIHTVAHVLEEEEIVSKSATITLNIPGAFNIQNALAAIAAARACDVEIETAVAALANFKAVPGRMEKIDAGQNFHVFVDFAVSPEAYKRVLETLRMIVGEDKRVLVLCSSCGNRMKEKRPHIGRICSELADVTVVTEDETYGEDPLKALEEVWAGVDQTKTQAHKISDRRAAIAALFHDAQAGDAVVLCGMGPFTTMTTLKGRIPWDERQVARELLHTMTHQQ